MTAGKNMKHFQTYENVYGILIYTSLVGIGIISGWLAKDLTIQHRSGIGAGKSLKNCDSAYKQAKRNLLPGENLISVNKALNIPGGLKFMKLGLEFDQEISVENISNSVKFKHNIWNRFDHLCVLGGQYGSINSEYVITFSEINLRKFAKITYSSKYPSVVQEFTLVSGEVK